MITRIILSVFFGFSMVFHILAVTWPQISIPEPAWEHVLFAGINAWLLFLTNYWKEMLPPFLLALWVEQFAEHAPLLLKSIQEGKLDIQSLIAIVGTTIALLLVVGIFRKK